MKRTLTLITCVAVCCAMTVSCKNAKNSAPTPEEIQAQKVALADSVLAEMEAFADNYFTAHENGFHFRCLELTDDEKAVKPDYLLDPSIASNLLTKTQKVNALAFYLVDFGVRMLYDMPTEEAKESIAKLATDVNFPVDIDNIQVKTALADPIKKLYDKCKEDGSLADFWQFQNAFITETCYIIAQNPELFFSKVTEEQWQSFYKKLCEKNKAMSELAKYDEEMKTVQDHFNQVSIFSSAEERDRIFSSKESTKQFDIANKDKYTTRRNALLQ